VTDQLEARREAAVKRAGEQIRWYSRYSVSSGVLYRVFQTLAVVLSAITPVLILWTELSPVLQALPAAGAAISAALVGIYGWQENKARFAFTAESLKSELVQYETRTGPYTGTEEQALNRFVGRIERIGMDETAQWRTSYTRAGGDAGHDDEDQD
jgi:Protein of unknown function (DUF4231)